MAVKKSKKGGPNIQQAAGLIRYFDEESEDAIHISKGAIYFTCIAVSTFLYLLNNNVLQWGWAQLTGF
ncbi:MAG TPA: preprotein translocase subunit Sec61beta [Candidatus Poseidoniales archaeon]|nr:preprotein translocase subunit Sec61beta [Candidatus Poseidoniales archaeon]